MKKLYKTVLMFCLMFPMVAWSYTNKVTRTDKDGTPLLIIKGVSHSGFDRSNTILAFIEGHQLTLNFSENLGQVAVEVSSASGTSVHYSLTPTPNGFQVYITNNGDYIITFTLPNGDEYYGEFTVSD